METKPASDIPVNPDHPIDAVLGTLIHDARAAKRGFALALAADMTEQGKTMTFRVEQVLPPADEWEPPVPYRSHIIEDADSMVAFGKKYGSAEKSLIFYDDTGAELVIDETKQVGQCELVTMDFAYAAEWKAWEAHLNRGGIEHKPLLTHLILNQHTLVQPEMLAKMRSIKATFSAKLDSDLREDSETVGVVFSAQAGDELVKFPREFDILVPVLDLDVDTLAAWRKVKVRVEVQLPTEPKQPVRFQLLAPMLNAIRRQRINEECAKLKAGLPDWTIVRGDHQEVERVLGRKK